MSGKVARYYHTVKHLRPGQIAGQLAKPFILKAKVPVASVPGLHLPRPTTMIPALDLDAAYLSRFDADRLMEDEFTLLNETHTPNLAAWQVDAPPLWRFNLHYFEYAIALAAKYRGTHEPKYYNKFKDLLASWMNANSPGTGDGWHPYTISMRLPNLLICFDLFGDIFENDEDFRGRVFQSIYVQYRALVKRKERWQLGNHYFENLKAIVLGSLLFCEADVYSKHIRLFLREVNEEILADGMHFELSPMYHKIVLEDIIRVAYWLRQAEKPQYTALLPVMQRMANALASLEKGMGKTPFFNDSSDGVAKEGAALLMAANVLFDIIPHDEESLLSSGYYKLYDGNIALMFDAGEIGPWYMAGHGHCDCLSFELSVDNTPLFVNAGTYQYQGELRKYFRSTKAHNTAMAGDREQSECWGEHRVARRISNVRAEKNGQLITGSYTSYSGDAHTRILSLSDGALTVLDSVVAAPSATVHSYLHIADGYEVRVDGGKVSLLKSGTLICSVSPVEAQFTVHTEGELTNYAPDFGILAHTCCIEFGWLPDAAQHGYVVQIYEKRCNKDD